MIAICFVCHGNICRSPTAEGVMLDALAAAGLEHVVRVESAGVSGEHEGEMADPRSRAAASRRGYRLEGRARRFVAHDFERFDLILALDRDNLRRLRSLAKGAADEGKLRLLREFDTEGAGPHDVPDPWYGGAEGFEEVLDLCERTCEGLLAHLRREYALGEAGTP